MKSAKLRVELTAVSPGKSRYGTCASSRNSTCTVRALIRSRLYRAASVSGYLKCSPDRFHLFSVAGACDVLQQLLLKARRKLRNKCSVVTIPNRCAGRVSHEEPRCTFRLSSRQRLFLESRSQFCGGVFQKHSGGNIFPLVIP